MAGRGLRRTLTISDQEGKEMAGRGLRRTLTISDQAKSEIKSTENDSSSSNNGADPDKHRRSLGHAAVGIPSPARGGRTLMDIIREEQKMSGSSSATGSIRNVDDGTINWKSFKDRIRLRRAGSAWSDPDLPDPDPTPHPNPNPSIPNPNLFGRSVSVRNSGSAPADDVPIPIPGRPGDNSGGGGGGGGGMSLMALFEQTEGGGFDDEDEEEEGEEDEEEQGEDDDDEELYHACCVCMVRHKGAAFVPCGHTLCRLCSRELLVSRGNCPLCNGFILEILDIF